jgi:hypothetical protein
LAANEKRSGAAEKKDTPAHTEKQYRVLHTIVLGRGESREARSSGLVTATEVGGERAIEQLLAAGMIADPDAAVRPSEASEHRARAVVVDIARRGGIITVDSERYTFDGKTYAGTDELQKVPLAAIGDAIVAALTAE